MAEVSMKDNEYLELIGHRNELEEVKKCITEGLQLEYECNEKWEYTDIRFTPQWPKEIQCLIRDRMAEQILEDEEALDYLIKQGKHHVNTHNFTIDKVWGNECPKGCVDLFTNATFYQRYQERMDALAEEGQLE